MSPAHHEALVIGAGLNGLGVAARLRARGVRAVVLDRGQRPGSSWESRYEGLRLNTTARLSSQPGLHFPRAAGRWPSREDVVAYAERYVRHHHLEVRHGVEVERIDTDPFGLSVRLADGARLLSRHVVVATGHDREPVMPAWPGLDGFSGEILHSASFTGASPFQGKRVLVIGCGMSGGDIARLLDHAGVERLWMSIRSAPHVYPEQLAGVALQPIAWLSRRLPAGLLDAMGELSSRIAFGDPGSFGLPRPVAGAETTWRRTGRTPLRDDGFVHALKSHRIEVVATVERFDGPDVILRGGRRIRPHAVIAATGYRPGLEQLVGHLGVLGADGKPAFEPGDQHPAAPGLHFAGMVTPLAGGLALCARVHGPRIVRAICNAAPEAAAPTGRSDEGGVAVSAAPAQLVFGERRRPLRRSAMSDLLTPGADSERDRRGASRRGGAMRSRYVNLAVSSRRPGSVRLAAVLVGLATIVSAAFAASDAPAGADPSRAFVVVIDGLQPEDVSPALTPNLWALQEGGQARVYPNAEGNMLSETNPNHVAMVTGTFGDTHGIFANELLDRERGEEADLDFPAHILVETLFDAIERQQPSLRTAAVMGKEKLKTLFDCTRPSGSEACGPSAENPERITVDHVRPDALRGASTTGELGEPPAEPLSGSGYSLDQLVMLTTIEVVRGQDPHYAFVNLPGVDGAQHLFGAHSVEARAAVVTADATIGLLVGELRRSGKWDESLLIVVSDHSFQEAGEQSIGTIRGIELGVSPPGMPLVSGSAIVLSDLFAGACVSPLARASFGWVSFGGAASVYIRDAGYDPYAGTALTDRQRRCLRELRGRALAREGVQHALYRLPVEGGVGLMDAVAPQWRLNTPRAGELILTADNVHSFLSSPTSADVATPGVHGGPAAQPIAFLVASGNPRLAPGIDATVARPIDVAPTVAALLGVDSPTASEGRVLTGGFLAIP